LSPLVSAKSWRTLGRYMGFGNPKSNALINSPEALAQFINSRASHVTQTSLYGYLKTRAGTRFPELFKNPDILTSINIAKWNIWLACVSDLCIFTGLLMHQSGRVKPAEIDLLMPTILDRILLETKISPEAIETMRTTEENARQRVTAWDWTLEYDYDSIFSQSPEALYYWSPIADELKTRDEEIVRNSVRFRWIEVRRSVREKLDIESIFQTEASQNLATSAEIN
ncbi:MAG: esterase, partial [Gammaproteobacteria bacterium]